MKFYPLFVNKSIMLRYIHKLNSGNLFLTCLFVFLFFSLSLIINIAFIPKETKLSRYSTIIQYSMFVVHEYLGITEQLEATKSRFSEDTA